MGVHCVLRVIEPHKRRLSTERHALMGVPLCLVNGGHMSVLTADCVGGGHTARRVQGPIVFGFLPSPLMSPSKISGGADAVFSCADLRSFDHISPTSRIATFFLPGRCSISVPRLRKAWSDLRFLPYPQPPTPLLALSCDMSLGFN